jgi:hypothetical protein
MPSPSTISATGLDTAIMSSPSGSLTTGASTPLSSVAAATTSSAACSSNLYNIPTTDNACALSDTGNHTEIMKACCKSASVISYYDGCGLYCLAQGQSVGELTQCMYGQGASYSEVFCRGGVNATATETGIGTVESSAGVSVVATGGGSSTGSSSSASSTNSKSAAAQRYGGGGGGWKAAMGWGFLGLGLVLGGGLLTV